MIKKIIFALAVAATAGVCAYAEPISDYIRDKYLHVDSTEVSRLEKAESLGLMEISTVILPEGENLWGKNMHFGWPVAAMINDTKIGRASCRERV